MKLNDPRWLELEGGYKIPYDPRPSLERLEKGDDVWEEFWENLHHQGDIGIASYAAVPHIVRICRSLSFRDWNLYSLLSTIEVERYRNTNPPLPDWLKEEYNHAWQDLLQLGITDLQKTTDPLIIRSILGMFALAMGDIKLGAFISMLDTSEVEEMLEDRMAWSEIYCSQQKAPHGP